MPEGAKARVGEGWISEITYSPDGARLAVTSSIGIWMYDVQTDEELDLLKAYRHWVNSVSFSLDGRTIVSGSWDKTIRLWDAQTDEHLRFPTT